MNKIEKPSKNLRFDNPELNNLKNGINSLNKGLTDVSAILDKDEIEGNSKGKGKKLKSQE